MTKKEKSIDSHLKENTRTPIKKGAFELSNEDKIKYIEKLFTEVINTLGLNLSDDSLRATPLRIAKMYVEEIFSGLDPDNRPKPSTFINKYQYGEMLVEKNITVYSTCEHHFLPIVGMAHIAYISNGNVIGLSKINRIVDYYARRPQVQERMTMQIVQELQNALETEDVACMIDAKHLCVNSRGIRHTQSSTITSEYGGKFKQSSVKKDFLDYVKIDSFFNT